MSEIYRDPTEGATAKRQELLRRRRDELATMPHAIRRVVVARSGRRAGGLALTLGGLALSVMALDSGAAAYVARQMPGIQPAPLSTALVGLWLLGIAAYLVARVRAEHRFAVAMSHYVLPGADLSHDIERLDHEHPDEVARQMAHKLEVSSAAWPVVGLAFAVPATALYIRHVVAAHGWPQISEFELAVFAHAGLFVKVGIAGALLGLVLTHRGARRAEVVRPAIAALFVTGVFAGALHSATVASFLVLPATLAFVLWKLRRERKMIAAEDPAAGSEMFSLRDALRATWSGTVGIFRKIDGRALRKTLLAATPLALCVFGYLTFAKRHVAAEVISPSIAAVPQLAPVEPSEPELIPNVRSTMPVTPHANRPQNFTAKYQADGSILMSFDVDSAAVEIPALAGAQVPRHWGVTVVPTVETGAGDVTVTSTGSARTQGSTTAFSADTCAGAAPLALIVTPIVKDAHHVTLVVRATMAPVGCPALR